MLFKPTFNNTMLKSKIKGNEKKLKLKHFRRKLDCLDALFFRTHLLQMALNGIETTITIIAEDQQNKIRLAELETFSNMQ